LQNGSQSKNLFTEGVTDEGTAPTERFGMKTKPLLTRFFQCLVCALRCNCLKKQYNMVGRWLRKGTMKLCKDKDGAELVIFSSDIQTDAREQTIHANVKACALYLPCVLT